MVRGVEGRVLLIGQRNAYKILIGKLENSVLINLITVQQDATYSVYYTG